MDAMLEATREASAFLKVFRNEFTNYAAGDEGIAREVALLWGKTVVASSMIASCASPHVAQRVHKLGELGGCRSQAQVSCGREGRVRGRGQSEARHQR